MGNSCDLLYVDKLQNLFEYSNAGPFGISNPISKSTLKLCKQKLNFQSFTYSRNSHYYLYVFNAK